MLILTRRPGEKILIGGEDIQIMLIAINGQQGRIGVKAPRNLVVHREEVYARIHPEYNPTDWQPTEENAR